jgi:hypothetical protein
MIAVHICAPNDVNGNPQRCFAVLDEHSEIAAVVDEGYEGEAALRSLGYEVELCQHRIEVSEAEYMRWLRISDPV